ncbi:MAG: mannose-1-phosphate guanyltransferase [Gemmatimonadetes bacterium]|nr:mannose-1-phosphate guanyltransferase [Gemmatimonadota bacterium]
MRLRPFTEAIPKPLLPLGEKAIMEIQIERLAASGFREVFVATNYKADYIERFLGDGSKYGVDLSVSKEEEPLGTVGPLTLLRDRLTEPFLVLNGDILTSADFSEFYRFAVEKGGGLSVAIKKLLTPFQFGNIFFDGDRVTGVEEKPDLVTWILAGIYVMTPELFKVIPPETHYNMDQLINDLLAREEPVVKFELNEYWLDIGRFDDYQKAQDAYENHFREDDGN